MNFKVDLTSNQQKLLQQIGIKIEDEDYSSEEIKHCLNEICNHVMSKSSKNGDISREMIKFNELSNMLIKYEK